MKIFPVFLPWSGCPCRCVFCNQNLVAPEPDLSVILPQAEAFTTKNAGEEREIAFFGGTFTNMPIARQVDWFNNFAHLHSQGVGFRISTRPDALHSEDLLLLKNMGLTTVELGVQSLDEKVLQVSGRGYNRAAVMAACELVRRLNLKLCLQMMIGLPGEDEQALRDSMQATIELKPDFVRIFPTLVLEDTTLASWWIQGRYQPMSLEDAVKTCVEWLPQFEKAGIRVIKIGLQGDLNSEHGVLAGPVHPAFGELVRGRLLVDKIVAEWSEGLTLCISYKDEGLFNRDGGYLKGLLKNRLHNRQIKVKIDRNLPKGDHTMLWSDNNQVW